MPQGATLPTNGTTDLAESRLARFLEAFLPPERIPDDLELRIRARLLVGLGLVLFGVSATMILGQVFRGTLAGVWIGCAIAAMDVGILISLRAGTSIATATRLMLAYIYLGSVGLTIASGGKAVAAVLVACLIPAVAYVLQGLRGALGWTLATFAGVALAAIYGSSTDTYLYSGRMLAWEQWRFAAIAAPVGFIYLATLIFDRALRLALDEAARSNAQVKSQDAKYRALVDSVGDVLMEYDAASRCVYVSPNCPRMTGWGEEQMLGKAYCAHVHPDDLARNRHLLESLRDHPGETRSFAMRVRDAKGDWLFGYVSIRSVLTPGDEIHFVSVFRDFTDLRRAELAMRHSERLASAGTLAAGIAHQINNPVGSIRAASELALLCARDGDFADIVPVLEANIEQASRCGEIIRSLLQFAAREASDKTRHDLVALALRARDFTISYAHQSAVEIEIDSAQRPIWIEVCAIEIEQVLVNLIRNAIEAKPASGRVDVAIRCVDKLARVEVTDDGCGIAEQDPHQVFDPFYTTRIREGGSGLGLSVAHGIVRDHGGRMDVSSSPGKGTRMIVELPLDPSDGLVDSDRAGGPNPRP